MTNPERIAKGLWWDRPLKLVEGCSPVSTGCDHCWSASEAHIRAGQQNQKIREQYRGLTDDNGDWNGQIRLMEKNLELPLRVKKPTTWAVWNDLCHPAVPFDFFLDAINMMCEASQHTYLILTKRPEILAKHIRNIEDWDSSETPHIWFGVTAENQEQADKRIPVLLQIPAAVWFVSVEPMLGPVDLEKYLAKPSERICKNCWQFKENHLSEKRGLCRVDKYSKPYTNTKACVQFEDRYAEDFEVSRDWLGRLDWVVCGGESGPGARPMHPDWARNLRDQCKAAGAPFFFKQWGEWAEDLTNYHGELLESFRVRWMHQDGTVSPIGSGLKRDGDILINHIGKKAAGCLLDGREYKEMPRVANG